MADPAESRAAVPTRVLLVATQLCARVPGGTGRYVEELLAALVSSLPTGGQLAATAPRGCAAAARLAVPVEPLSLPLPVLARLWDRNLPPRLAGSRVVHAPTLMVPTVASGTPLVVTVHDLVPWTHPETLTARGVEFHRRMGARAAREARVIVTPTDAVARQVREILAPRGEVVAVPSGVRVTDAPHDAAERRARLGADGDYLLFVGTAEPRKGLDTLVAALARSDLARSRLVVVGPPGWGDVRVADLAASAGVSDRVVITGRLTELDLAAVYAGATALAMPSRAEGFGFPVLEAMAHRVPVVISDDPALTEVSGGAAFVTPVGDVDALAASLAGAGAAGQRRDDAVRAGWLRAQEFDWARTAASMWSIYASVSGG